jgi:hypothetical protein
MANYTALEAYALFTPPSEHLLFPTHVPLQLQAASPIEVSAPVSESPNTVPVQPSPSPSSPEEAGYPYDESPINSSNEPVSAVDNSIVKAHSASPAMSQLYAMKRK